MESLLTIENVLFLLSLITAPATSWIKKRFGTSGQTNLYINIVLNLVAKGIVMAIGGASLQASLVFVVFGILTDKTLYAWMKQFTEAK
jgi:hypothetical protein